MVGRLVLDFGSCQESKGRRRRKLCDTQVDPNDKKLAFSNNKALDGGREF